jgi:hypothetical protein
MNLKLTNFKMDELANWVLMKVSRNHLGKEAQGP